MTNNLLVLGAEQINDALNGKESEIIEIVKNTYLFHNEGKTALPHSIFLRFPNDERNRIIGLPAYIGGDYNIAGMKWISLDLCQYFGHKKLNIFSLHDINT